MKSEVRSTNLRGPCMKRLLTLWRMSAVRVRLPPAGVKVRIIPIRGDFVDVDKSFYLSRRSLWESR
jgi:hypothetical protein